MRRHRSLQDHIRKNRISVATFAPASTGSSAAWGQRRAPQLQLPELIPSRRRCPAQHRTNTQPSEKLAPRGKRTSERVHSRDIIADTEIQSERKRHCQSLLLLRISETVILASNRITLAYKKLCTTDNSTSTCAQLSFLFCILLSYWRGLLSFF